MSFQLYQPNAPQRDLPAFSLNQKLNDPSLYLPSADLANAVNVALALGQPLLLTGEPGTGKTQLAYHIAHFFKLDKPLIFNAQTNSAANDLFYRYDALGHFQYNQNHSDPLSIDDIEKRFVRYEALGEAIRSGQRRVVLIDEIDKAPRDLPNDILAAIERLAFRVAEIGKSFETQTAARPIIVLTSNSEKNLPDAFLRRVVYFHIPFPNEAQLLTILASKMDNLAPEAAQILVSHFTEIRNLKLKKSPATAELIGWTTLLQKVGFDTTKLRQISKLDTAEKTQLLASYSVLAKNKEDLEVLKNSF